MFPLRRYELEYYYTFREFVEAFPYSEEIDWYSLFHNSVPYAPLYTNVYQSENKPYLINH